ELDDERHEHLLRLDAGGGALPQDALEEHALVGDVLVDDPQAAGVHRENERIANLAQRLERGEGERVGSGFDIGFRRGRNFRRAAVGFGREGGGDGGRIAGGRIAGGEGRGKVHGGDGARG